MKRFKKIVRIIFIWVPLSLVALSLFWILVLKFVPVYYTPLMFIRSIEYRNDPDFNTTKNWTRIEDISDNMALAVISSEDNKFLTHSGFDWDEVQKSIDANKRGKRLRGASTISQQTAKNVFLYPGRSWFRKGLEVYFTSGIELVWGKKRIMEVYLNVAEMGKGIYGAGAASEVFFNKPALKLTRYESALIASALPNPLKRRVNRPSQYMLGRAGHIVGLMNNIAYPGWNDFLRNEKKKNNN